MHQAIKDNIEYWSRQIDWLNESPPFHTSYYCVEENGQLEIYAVKWNGADLWKGEISKPDNWADLLADVAPIIARGKGHGAAIGDGAAMGNMLRVVDCYVFDSPLRRVKKWQSSYAGSLLREQEVTPQSHSFKVNKQTHSVRFIDESEDSVTVLVEPKG